MNLFTSYISQHRHIADGLNEIVAGVNLNATSKHLLTSVSGLSLVLAQNIMNYRRENAPFESRAQLKKVPRQFPKSAKKNRNSVPHIIFD